MAQIIEEWMVCPDCLPVIANGDYTHLDYSYGEEQADAIIKKTEQGLNSAPGSVYVSNSEMDLEFSTMPCDCCGTKLAGARHNCVILG